jgi:ATP-dependent RNA helicase SUPV3L1/SUV3
VYEACTVELINVNKLYDFGIIDEAQMMSDPDRGHNWTQAILGLASENIHICTAPEALNLCIHLIEECGDTYEVDRTERLQALECQKKQVNINAIEPGDAIVVFSRKAVLDCAARLEKAGKKVSVLYGALPPDVRRKQAHLFNSGDTDILVCTDCIGMGINARIRRVVFFADSKFDGVEVRGLTPSDVLQIAGRAGRYGKFEKGYVACGEGVNIKHILRQFNSTVEDLVSAPLFPSVELLNTQYDPAESIRAWRSMPTSKLFTRSRCDEELRKLDIIESSFDYKSKVSGKYIIWKMARIPFDIDMPRLNKQWLLNCALYLDGKDLSAPVIDLSGELTLTQLEMAYKELDLHYAFHRQFGLDCDRSVIENKYKVSLRIHKKLLESKGIYLHTCRICSKVLPVGNAFNICNVCYDERQKNLV